MEKLIHERLREYDERSCSFICDNGRFVMGLWNSEANSLADEIEKYYIPRPRFEDGEPVQFGDDIEIYNRTGLLDSGTIQSFHPNNGSVWMLSLVGFNHERLVRFDPETCVIQRPEPKALDSDGIEIKVGDTVWIVKTGVKGTVKNVGGNRADIEWDDGRWSGDINAKNLTHEKPVFASDGERIKVGDTVWDIDSGEKLTVVEFANREHSIIQCSHEDDGYCDDFDAYKLTHREPDSLKKAVDDLGELLNYPMCDDIKLDKVEEVYNRLTAIMERDA